MESSWVLALWRYHYTEIARICSRVRDLNTGVGVISAIMLVFAYFCIFGSVVYSFCFKMRPLRKKIEAKVAGMADKKLNDFYLERQAEYDRKGRAQDSS